MDLHDLHDLHDLKVVENPDMTVEIYGELLNGSGIIIRLTNVDYVNEQVIHHWKTVMMGKGYLTVVEHDISAGHVTINCREKERVSWTTVGIVLIGVVLVVRYLYV